MQTRLLPPHAESDLFAGRDKRAQHSCLPPIKQPLGSPLLRTLVVLPTACLCLQAQTKWCNSYAHPASEMAGQNLLLGCAQAATRGTLVAPHRISAEALQRPPQAQKAGSNSRLWKVAMPLSVVAVSRSACTRIVASAPAFQAHTMSRHLPYSQNIQSTHAMQGYLALEIRQPGST